MQARHLRGNLRAGDAVTVREIEGAVERVERPEPKEPPRWIVRAFGPGIHFMSGFKGRDAADDCARYQFTRGDLAVEIIDTRPDLRIGGQTIGESEARATIATQEAEIKVLSEMLGRAEKEAERSIVLRNANYDEISILEATIASQAEQIAALRKTVEHYIRNRYKINEPLTIKRETELLAEIGCKLDGGLVRWINVPMPPVKPPAPSHGEAVPRWAIKRLTEIAVEPVSPRDLAALAEVRAWLSSSPQPRAKASEEVHSALDELFCFINGNGDADRADAAFYVIQREIEIGIGEGK